MFIQKLFFVGILKVNDEKSRIRIQDPDTTPDPLVRGMDPRIRIHSKMSRIRNTAHQCPIPNLLMPVIGRAELTLSWLYVGAESGKGNYFLRLGL
jgi:hypothetical protein